MILSKLNSTIPVAHLNIRGTAVLVAFLDTAFDSWTPQERDEIYAALQAAAVREGLRGEVAAVWEDPEGRIRFIAPPQQHPFFELMNYEQLRAQANGTIQVSAP